MPVKNLLQVEIKVINIGLIEFFDSLIIQKVAVIHVNWKPPAQSDSEMVNILNKLL